MVHHLEVLQIGVVQFFGLDRPFQVETVRSLVRVLDPPSLQQSLLQVLVPPRNDKNLTYKGTFWFGSSRCFFFQVS